MSAFRRAAISLVVMCALLLPATTTAAYASPSPMVDQINAVRWVYGLPTLRYSHSLSRSSLSYGYHQLRSGQFSHGARIWASNRFSMVGEILAMTPSWEINRTRTIVFWLVSPTHRAVMLSRSFRYIGAARVQGYLAGREATLWTVQFGKKRRRASG